MKSKLSIRLLKISQVTSIAIAIGVALIWLILQGYSASWTGFGDYTRPDGEFVRGKTLWDWMQLFLVSLTLSVRLFFLNRAEREIERQRTEDRVKLEREIALDRQQEAALQTYFDKISDLLLKEKLLTTDVKEVRDVARTRSISILRVLDTRRSNLVIQFLREAKLITDENSILNGANMVGMNLQGLDFQWVYLQGANLDQADLRGAKLWDANLQRCRLQETNLSQADLQGANLQGVSLWQANITQVVLMSANLQGARFSKANLQDADLSDANMQGADFSDANLQNASLHWASLKDAKVTEEQLAKVHSLKGVTMPDGTTHD